MTGPGLGERGLPVDEQGDHPGSFEPLRQRTTPAAVADVLRAAILAGTLPPATQLRETHIAAELGISRAPLREALTLLSEEGLVVRIPFRGAFVAESTAETIAEIAGLRGRLDPFAIELALPRLDAGARSRASRLVDDMALAADRGDVAAGIEAHLSFHRFLYELADHRLLLDLWKSWETQLRLFLAVDHRSYDDLRQVAAEHARLLEIIESGDLRAIRKELAHHVHDAPGHELAPDEE